MSETIGTQDLVEQLVAKKHNRAVRPSAQEFKPMDLGKAIGTIESSATREWLTDKITKDLKSTDISSLRLVSLADKTAELRNQQTVFLNMLEANPVQRVTDFQMRFRERRLGQNVASFFNLNQDAFAPEAVSNRPSRTNTLGFMGNALNIRIIAQELGAQSPVQPVDLVQEEIEFEITRIRRAMNAALLVNQEVVSESAGNTAPQPGGFVNRSTLYNTALGVKGDFTNAIIQSAQDQIANAGNPEGISYNVPLVCLCPLGQISKIRDLMISRYPGENSQAALETQAELRARFAQVGIAPYQMKSYQPDPGQAILFIAEPILQNVQPGTAIFFDPTQPMLAQFQINGQYGPWALERPTAALTTLLYTFNGFSLMDPLVESRSVVTNLNS
jgi:hypothetical protein